MRGAAAALRSAMRPPELSAVACGRFRARPTRRFQHCRDILGGPGIRKHGEAILSGARIRSEVLARFRDSVLGWLTGPEGPPPPDESIEWLRFSEPLFKQLDVGGHARRALAGEGAGDRALVGRPPPGQPAARSSCRFRIPRMWER